MILSKQVISLDLFGNISVILVALFNAMDFETSNPAAVANP